MGERDERVKRMKAMRELGFSASEVVQKELGDSLAAFAEVAECRANEVSMCLNGYPGRIYGSIRDALAETLGINRADIDLLIDGESGSEPEAIPA